MTDFILTGKIIKDGRTIKHSKTASKCLSEKGVSFHDALEKCLIDVCKKLDIPLPLWLSVNTREFSGSRRTAFHKDQFTETVLFDRFEIHFEQDINSD